MTDPKWVYSRIQFELAAAIKASGGRLHIDDALLIAGVPCVLVDYANVPDHELKYISRAMRQFFKRNPRFHHFTKKAVEEGLRLEWLPNLEDEDKVQMLADFKMTPGVDESGYVIFDRAIVDRLTEKDHPDHERYGTGDYTRVNLNGAAKRLRPDNKEVERYFNAQDAEGYWSAPLTIAVGEWYEIIKETSPLIKEYLACYTQVFGGIASTLDIENWFGLNNDSVNARNTALGRRAQRMLDIEVLDPADADKHIYWSTPMLRGRSEKDGFRWQMRPELIEAAKRLAKEENWDLPIRLVK